MRLRRRYILVKAKMTNKITVDGDDAFIEIINRKGEIFIAIIDKDQLEKIVKFNRPWHVGKQRKDGEYYVYCTLYNGIINGKYSYNLYGLHNLIMDIMPGDNSVEIDHIEHGRLDNRKKNLRLSARSENLKNRAGKNSNNKSGYRNVCFNDGWYIVQLQVNGKNHRFKEKFVSAEEANIFAIEMRKVYYKEYSGNN